MKVLYGEMSWPEVKEAVAADAIVILPTGCIEQHGPHLPLDCDCDAGTPAPAIARACQEHGLRAVVLPVLPYGPAAEHMSFPGTISLSQETHQHVVREIVSSLLHHGFRRVVIMRGCGGHVGLEAAVYELWSQQRRRGRDVFIEVAPIFVGLESVQQVVRHWFPDIQDVHAGEGETSMVLATRPHLVATERIPQTKCAAPSHGSWWARVEEISENGATGEPSRAGAEAGQAILAAMEEAMAQWLAEFDHRTRRPGSVT
jgi:creatinine amidohydrolase